ncbi:MAG: hypothetical protein SXG53_24195, partial [Pseudomonadota bacterium]|nr:hypothetical protein [Pseudomonadota bacterium]
ALCMLALFHRTRAVLYLGWAVVFAFLLLDDAFQFHENFGHWLGSQYSLPVAFGLRSEDIGELLFASLIGGATVLLIGFGYWRGDADARIVARDIALLVIVLAALGVGVDMLHVITYFKAPLLGQVLLIVEDGGEMLVVSAIAAYTFNILVHQGRVSVNLWACVRSLISPERKLAKG